LIEPIIILGMFPLLLTPITLLVHFMVNWVTPKMFALRKMVFLTKITKDQNLAMVKGFVLTAIELVILLIFATRNMGILLDINPSMVRLLNSTTSPLAYKKKVLKIKIRINKIVEEISASLNINIRFSQTF